MHDIYIGSARRITREFLQNGATADLDALTIDIKDESGEWLVTTAEGTFHDLDIIANKSATGKYFTKITPDAAETVGVYLLYWTATYGEGDSAETFTEGPDVIFIHSEAALPDIADNYLSLDAIKDHYPALFDLDTPANILRQGANVSRDIDTMLDERFSVPIKKRTDGTYDPPLVDAAAFGTIASVLERMGHREESETWYERTEKMVDSINAGRRRLAEEITADEIGFGPPRPWASNQSTNTGLELFDEAVFTGDYHRKIIIKIDGAGALGTATYKVSLNAGNTWEVEAQSTYADEQWLEPAGCEGLVFRFYQLATSAELKADDYWTIEAYPARMEPTVSKRGIRTRQLNL